MIKPISISYRTTFRLKNNGSMMAVNSVHVLNAAIVTDTFDIFIAP